jgi:mannose-6-phosphate isomerase class I
VVRPAPSQMRGTNNRHTPLIAAPYFVVDMFEMKEPQDFSTIDDSSKNSAHILVALEGFGVIETVGAEQVTMAKGDALVIPASSGKFTVRPQWTFEFLKSYVPGAVLPEPQTRI